MSLSKQLTGGMAWLVSGRFGNAIVSAVSTAVMARLLSPGDFGVIAAAWVVIALANVLFDGAFGQNLLRNRSTDDAAVRTTLTIGLLLSIFLAAVIVLSAPAIGRYFGFPDLALALALMSIVVPLKAIFSIATSQLQLQGRFRGMASSTLGSAIVGNILVGIPLGLLGWGVWALVSAALAAAFAEAALLSWQARLPFKPLLRTDIVRDVFGAGLFSVANVMNWAANTSANAIVGRTMGEMSLGIYSRGWKLLDLFIAAVATPLSRVLLPGFIKLRDDKARLAAALEDSLWLAVPGYTVIAILFTLHTPFIVRIALGPKWDDTIVVGQVLFAALMPRCAVKIAESFTIAHGSAMMSMMTQATYAALMICGALVGARHDIFTVAAAISVAITVFYVISLTYAVRLAAASVSTVVSLHVRTAILALPIIAVDLGLLHVLEAQPLLLRHAVAGTGSGLLALGIALMWPAMWFGPRNAVRVTRQMRTLRESLAARRRLGAAGYGR